MQFFAFSSTLILLLFALALGWMSEIDGIWLVNAFWILLFVAALRLSKIPREVIAGLMALGIGAALFFLQLYFWPQVTNLQSDPLMYDAVATNIAANVSLLNQLNPLAFEYVHEAERGWGAIANPGFYKILGIVYSVLGNIPDRHVLSAAFINVTSYAVVGFLLMKLFDYMGCGRKASWALWLIFMLSPWLIEQLYVLRKDMLLLSLTAGSLYVIVNRWHWTAIVSIIYCVGTIRFPQAVILLGIWLVILFCNNRRYARYFRSKYFIFFGIFASILLLAVVMYDDTREFASESIAALDNDRQKASTGFSKLLEASAPGVFIYVLIYPFPNLIPKDLYSIWQSIFAYLAWAGFAAVFYVVKKMRFADSFIIALLWGLIITLFGMFLQALAAWKVLGYVVAESRFKLFTYLMLVLLVARVIVLPINIYTYKRSG